MTRIATRRTALRLVGGRRHGLARRRMRLRSPRRSWSWGRTPRPMSAGSWASPDMVWEEESGAKKLEYPRGPMGTQTYFVFIGPDGKYLGMERVLVEENFAKVKVGMTRTTSGVSLASRPR